LGPWEAAAAAAPTAGADELPLGDVCSMSPFVRPWSSPLLGGPIEVEVGVMSMGSRGGASVEPEDGRMGMDLCRFGLCGSGEKGLLRASATDAIIGGVEMLSRSLGAASR
jgi:hypothetical protein